MQSGVSTCLIGLTLLGVELLSVRNCTLRRYVPNGCVVDGDGVVSAMEAAIVVPAVSGVTGGVEDGGVNSERHNLDLLRKTAISIQTLLE